MLGEEQFRGVQIYDVIQDKQLNYWFATSEGIFNYDYHTFEKIECDQAKGNSIFRLLINNEGTIYCHNLNNQVFQIKNKTCSVFYELQTSESSSDISLSIADDGNLIIGAKHIMAFDKTGKQLSHYFVPTHYVGSGYTSKNNGIQFHLNGIDSVIVYRKGLFSKQKLTFLSGKLQTQSVLKFYNFGQASYAIDLKTKEHYSYNPSRLELSLLPKNNSFNRWESVRIYETGNDFWIAGTLPGVSLDNTNMPKTNSPVYYNDYFISDVMKDAEGNSILSTFDKGILVIPDTKVPDVIHSFKDDPVTALYADSTVELMIGTSKGNFMNYSKGQLLTLNTKGKRSVKAIYGHPGSDVIIFDDGYIRAYNKHANTIADITDASLKDVATTPENILYLGTNRGIIQVTANKNHSFTTRTLKDMSYRVYSLAYNPADSCLYASTSIGLHSISYTGIVKKIFVGSEPVFPNYLHSSNGVVYASTKKSGILILKNSSVIKTIHPMVNEKEETPEKIILYQNTMIVKSSNGIFQFDMDGKLLKSIHAGFGFSSKSITDFTCYKNYLWVSHARGIQSIDLNYTNSSQKPIIRLDRILVNDQATDLLQVNFLKSDQRKIQFIFSSPTLKNRENIRYHYKLTGYDLKWNTGNYKTDQITYSALAPGDYTFHVKAEHQGIFSEQVVCSFTILSPFYMRWWFIALVVILFLGIVYKIYRRQLSIQQKKLQQINELNTSKLIAIQSQMNPHFIFNSLNSIQDLILKGNVEHSYSYITIFSNLVRRTLSYSEKDFIDFEQEIKLLELYLSLEKLRFKKDLNYAIDTKNVTDVMLPPLLIQPFIENALIHGLLHKEGQKNLKITFELKETLICTIEDDGIGREKSKAIKQRQRSEHESFSGKAIRNRFEILSNVFGGDFGYTYADLYENGEATGTKVILTIPVKHKF